MYLRSQESKAPTPVCILKSELEFEVTLLQVQPSQSEKPWVRENQYLVMKTKEKAPRVLFLLRWGFLM